MNRIKLGKHQREIMKHLAKAGELGASVLELCECLSVDSPSTARLGLRGLIARGYVLRQKDGLNPRSHRYFIRELGFEWLGAENA